MNTYFLIHAIVLDILNCLKKKDHFFSVVPVPIHKKPTDKGGNTFNLNYVPV